MRNGDADTRQHQQRDGQPANRIRRLGQHNDAHQRGNRRFQRKHHTVDVRRQQAQGRDLAQGRDGRSQQTHHATNRQQVHILGDLQQVVAANKERERQNQQGRDNVTHDHAAHTRDERAHLLRRQDVGGTRNRRQHREEHAHQGKVLRLGL